jgi:hypothetical protein
VDVLTTVAVRTEALQEELSTGQSFEFFGNVLFVDDFMLAVGEGALIIIKDYKKDIAI